MGSTGPMSYVAQNVGWIPDIEPEFENKIATRRTDYSQNLSSRAHGTIPGTFLKYTLMSVMIG